MEISKGAALFLCFGNQDECICCGGSVHADPMPGEAPGPFEAPEGSLAPGRYCSESCWADWEACLQREAHVRKNQIRCCHLCGFDNKDHDDWCPFLQVDDHRNQVARFGERGIDWRWTGPWQLTHLDCYRRPLTYRFGRLTVPATVTVAP